MISLSTAQKLKVVGPKWEPREGDFFYNLRDELVTWDMSVVFALAMTGMAKDEKAEKFTFAPRLDQLLSEIERQDYWWQLDWLVLDLDGVKKYDMQVSKRHDTSIQDRAFRSSDSPEDAVAAALLWILEQEKCCA
jgi:hypothetical protein